MSCNIDLFSLFFSEASCHLLILKSMSRTLLVFFTFASPSRVPGNTLRCDVTGKILMKCFLSGMPDLKLGLNDKIGLEKEAQAKARPSRRLVACVL